MKYSTAQFHLFNWLSFRVLLLLSRTRFTHVSPGAESLRAQGASASQHHLSGGGGGRAERASSTPHIAPQKLKINKFLQTLLEISQKLSKVKGG